VLMIGVTYLLFFWKRRDEISDATAAHHVE
jgi:hypothetical protein